MMRIARTIAELRGFLENLSGATGFVPTMGSLHGGHASLVAASRKRDRVTVCSLFVNPRQFNDSADFRNYPRNEAADLGLLEKNGCALAFVPVADELYRGYDPPPADLGRLDRVMEGTMRKGHFQGVAYVVRRLFELVQPERAYFGEKDFQQLAVIRQLVRSEGLPVEVVGCATVRDEDGLAMSSRNVRLSADERAAAGIIYTAMVKAAERYAAGISPHEAESEGRRMIEQHALFTVEYFEFRTRDTLVRLSRPGHPGPARLFTAVQASATRLIDNLEVREQQQPATAPPGRD